MSISRQSRRWYAVLAWLVAGAGFLGVAAANLRRRDHAAAKSAASTAAARDQASLEAALREPAVLAKARADFEQLRRRAQQEFRARVPRPSVPEAERGPWIAAWNEMRACARRHGFDGVSEVEATYGDGQTPMPNVDLDLPNAQVALKACPFAAPNLAATAR